MKLKKRKLSERDKIYLTVSFEFVTHSLWEEKMNGLCGKNDCCDFFNEIPFQID